MFPKIINKQYKHNFQIKKDGLCAIEIAVRCKNWWQNKLRLFGDDDLRVEIDGIKFPKLYPKKRGLFDGPANWNGNKLKNLSQTNIFVVYLIKGAHILQFYSNQTPVLEKIDVQEFAKNLIKKELYPEDGERRPWLNVILVNLPLRSINISTSAKDGKAHEKNKQDDDNLKIIIDGQVQKNTSNKSHKRWYWCGKISKGGSKFFTKKLNFKPTIHYIELWADRTPTLQNLELDLGKRIPSVDDPKWTGDFKDDIEQMILARAIFGEARGVSRKGKIGVGWSIRNRVESLQWGDTYSEVILQSKQYSAFNKSDKNRPFVENPFYKEDQIDKWYECCGIAGQVMNGEVNDPTNGANHYFSDYIDNPEWIKSKQAEFKIKIDNFLFYYLDFKKSARILKKLALFIGFVILAIGAAQWYQNNYSDMAIVPGNAKQETYHFTIYSDEVYKVSDNTGAMVPLTYNGFGKSNLILSPSRSKLGYYQDIHEDGEKINMKDSEVRKEYYDNYTSLKIMNMDSGEVKEVYRGSYKTSYWEWLKNEEVVVYRGCGTECMVGCVINIDTGKKGNELQYGVGYEWSPDKELVLAYNYSGDYGITIGDKNGKEIFSLKRVHYSSDNFDLIFATQAMWSPDGKTITVNIKKENQNVMETLILDINDYL